MMAIQPFNYVRLMVLILACCFYTENCEAQTMCGPIAGGAVNGSGESVYIYVYTDDPQQGCQGVNGTIGYWDCTDLDIVACAKAYLDSADSTVIPYDCLIGGNCPSSFSSKKDAHLKSKPKQARPHPSARKPTAPRVEEKKLIQ